MDRSIVLRLVVGALMAGSIYGIVGIGYNLIYKATGLMNLAQGDFLMFGAYIGMTFFVRLHLPYYAAIVLTFVVMFGLGWIVQLGLVTPLLEKGAKYSYVILCTAAVSMILQNSTLFIWGVKVQFIPSIFPVASINIFGTKVMPESLLVLGTSVCCAIALFFFMNKTRFGTAMRAAAQNQRSGYQGCCLGACCRAGRSYRSRHRPDLRRVYDAGRSYRAKGIRRGGSRRVWQSVWLHYWGYVFRFFGNFSCGVCYHHL